MGTIVIELTNRCNLHCHHCFSGRHGGRDDLPLSILDAIVAGAAELGFGYLTFTGGEPTTHRHFAEVLQRVHDGGYQFGFNSNGWNFATVYPLLLPLRDRLGVITFSLDGATAATHDHLRGQGSFRRVLQAISVCVAEALPFSVNMVVTAHNRHELAQMAQLAERLGSGGLRFGHLMPAPLTTDMGLDLSPWERKCVEAQVAELRRLHAMPIAMAPGYHATDLFPCAALQLQEFNVDCHGNVTKCCHLSGHGDGAGDGDVVGNLACISLADAYHLLVQENANFRRHKLAQLKDGEFRDTDFFHCWYCSLYYHKVDWLAGRHDHPWAGLIR
jgi:MoaA/NifB/PqqE/SkfB family radical SAM enzyme